MGIWHSISRQLSEPSGLWGKVVARGMNRGNAEMNARALEHLLPLGDSSVLELGFGGGATLPKLLEVAGHVTGLDRADDMVAAAKRRHSGEISAGRLRLDAGDIYDLPYDDGSFDRVLTVNTIYFWPDLHAALQEVHRVMARDGALVIGIRDPSVMEKVDRTIFTVREPVEVKAAVEAAGFTEVELSSPSGTRYHLITASARLPE